MLAKPSRRTLSMVVGALFWPLTCAFAADLHVPADYATIQAAINAAQPGDAVVVAAGTYTGAGNKSITVNKNVSISGAGPASTIIDCQGSGGAFSFSNGTTATLQGFAIQNAYAPGQAPIYSWEAVVTFRNLVVTGTTEGYAGGLYCYGDGVVIEDCQVAGNYGSEAGGIFTYGNAAVRRCTVTNNHPSPSAYWTVGGVWMEGGTVEDCVISGNSGDCGGMSIGMSDSIIRNCVVTDNEAVGTAGGGGGLLIWGFRHDLVNCLIANNSSATYGGGVYAMDEGGDLINCTIVANEATQGGGGVYCDGSTPVLTNTIVWGNTSDQIVAANGATPTATYCDIQGGFTGTGNINANPLFVDAAAGNYRVGSGSPCVDAGLNSAVPAGVSTDLSDLPRIVNGNADPAVAVDMGAFEKQPIQVPADYATIQAAINAAQSGDAVVVAAGTYTGTGNKSITVNKNLSISGAGPASTIIDCQGSGGAFSFSSGTTATLEGFAIRNAYAPGQAPIYSWEAVVTFRNLILTGTTDGYAGGLYCYGDGVVIEDCQVTNNRGTEAGGIFTYGNAAVRRCTVTNNHRSASAFWTVGGIWMEGGTVEDCVISGNSGDCGGMSIGMSDSIIRNCAITNNDAIGTAGGGGGLMIWGFRHDLVNCLIANNSSETYGGGVYAMDEGGNLINCTIAYNRANLGGGGLYCDAATPVLTNSIVYFNTADQILVNGGAPTVTYCDVQGGFTGTGNIDLDPLFVNAILQNYRLQATSPCLEMGLNTAVPAYVQVDLDGLPRFVDADGDSNLEVDMGAYERQ